MNIKDRLSLAFSVAAGRPLPKELIRKAIPNIYGVEKYDTNYGLTDYAVTEEMLASYKSWVFACVNIIAKAVSAARFRVYVRSGVDELKEVGEHPLVDLLENPNPFITRAEFLADTVAQLQLTGNAYWYKGKDRIGVPRELWTLPPDKMKVVPHATEFISGYTLRKDSSKTVEFNVDDVVHHRYPNPKNPYYGQSTLMAAASSVDTDSYQHNYSRNFYKNGANVAGVIEADSKLDEGVIKRLSAQWSSRYAGEENAGRTPILEGGMKYKPIGINPKDLDWLATNRITRDEILAIFGVPAALIGLVEDVNRANGETLEYTFHRQVVEPTLTLLDQRMTKDLAQPFDKRLCVIHDSTVPYDALRQAQAAKERINCGISAPNDEASALGYPKSPDPKANERWMPVNFMPMSLIGVQQPYQPDDQQQDQQSSGANQ